MDIYCPKCGEPYDADCLHDLIAYEGDADNDRPLTAGEYADLYRAAFRRWKTQGCAILADAYGLAPCHPMDPTSTAALYLASVYEISDHADDAAADLHLFPYL